MFTISQNMLRWMGRDVTSHFMGKEAKAQGDGVARANLGAQLDPVAGLPML